MPSLPELMPTQVSDETFGGVTYHIAGELVPVLSVDVTQMPVYFEHHILLWKNSTITIGLKSLKGALKRMMAGMQIFVTEASGAEHRGGKTSAGPPTSAMTQGRSNAKATRCCAGGAGSLPATGARRRAAR